jgi:hypothetical protein
MDEITLFLRLLCGVLIIFVVFEGFLAALIIKTLVGKIKDLQSELEQRKENVRFDSCTNL